VDQVLFATLWEERDMERLYYVESERGTAETSDRFEAARIEAEWLARGFNVETVVVELKDGNVQLADAPQANPVPAVPGMTGA
jgi:hypothetical protein